MSIHGPFGWMFAKTSPERRREFEKMVNRQSCLFGCVAITIALIITLMLIGLGILIGINL